jgi:NhaP-type Na+/H+ or K+/H+ antiporter
MEIVSSYNLIIEFSVIIILSFLFNGISKKTNIPAVLMLISLGIILQYILQYFTSVPINFFPILEVLGIVGLIMIVLEAALELELKREKLVPILKSLAIALISLMLSTWAAASILFYYIPEMSMQSAWLYATPLSILSSAIIIPSVAGLKSKKREFHIYESTFSDILGIMLFYFLTGKLNPAEDSGLVGFGGNLLLTVAISLIASYAIILVFQKIKSNVKLFLLIAVLLLLYALGKKMHLSSLIIILIFGLVIANMKLFFKGKLSSLLDYAKAHQIYHELHTITAETAFVVRTLFFVIFGLTIAITSLFDMQVALISSLLIGSIYGIRFIVLLIFEGKDIIPQVFIAPRGLITVLLFYGIPVEAQVATFEPGILLFVIIGTSLIMTFAMIYEKKRSSKAIDLANSKAVGSIKWKVPTVLEEDTQAGK